MTVSSSKESWKPSNGHPYGEVTQIQGSVAADFQFTGYYAHPTSGLDLASARAYNPRLARFISRDPLEEAADVNLFGYADNSPTNEVDPSGLSTQSVIPLGLLLCLLFPPLCGATVPSCNVQPDDNSDPGPSGPPVLNSLPGIPGIYTKKGGRYVGSTNDIGRRLTKDKHHVSGKGKPVKFLPGSSQVEREIEETIEIGKRRVPVGKAFFNKRWPVSLARWTRLAKTFNLGEHPGTWLPLLAPYDIIGRVLPYQIYRLNNPEI